MENYEYVATFKHGLAEGQVLAESAKDAKARVTAMYEGQLRDTGVDEDGNPTREATVVTNVKVSIVKG